MVAFLIALADGGLERDGLFAEFGFSLLIRGPDFLPQAGKQLAQVIPGGSEIQGSAHVVNDDPKLPQGVRLLADLPVLACIADFQVNGPLLQFVPVNFKQEFFEFILAEMRQAQQVAEHGAKPFIVIRLANGHEPQIDSPVVALPGEGGPQIARFQPVKFPGSQSAVDFLGRSNAAVRIEIIVRIILALVGKAPELVSANGAEPLHTQYLVSVGRQALEQQIAVLIGEIVFSGLGQLPRKVHGPLIVDVEKLQHGDERCLADIVGSDQMQRVDQFHLAIVVLAGTKQHQPCWPDNVHGVCSCGWLPSSRLRISMQTSKNRYAGVRKVKELSVLRWMKPNRSSWRRSPCRSSSFGTPASLRYAR